jgi:hypothetical protein
MATSLTIPRLKSFLAAHGAPPLNSKARKAEYVAAVVARALQVAGSADAASRLLSQEMGTDA